jgi:hypothetical protein
LLLFYFNDGRANIINPAHRYYFIFKCVAPLNPNTSYYHFPATYVPAPLLPPLLHHRHLTDRRQVHRRRLTHHCSTTTGSTVDASLTTTRSMPHARSSSASASTPSRPPLDPHRLPPPSSRSSPLSPSYTLIYGLQIFVKEVKSWLTKN